MAALSLWAAEGVALGSSRTKVRLLGPAAQLPSQEYAVGGLSKVAGEMGFYLRVMYGALIIIGDNKPFSGLPWFVPKLPMRVR